MQTERSAETKNKNKQNQKPKPKQKKQQNPLNLLEMLFPHEFYGFLNVFLFSAWVFLISEKQCDFPTVENGRIAQYYYTFKSFYFPMSVDKKLSFFCLAGYATESGKQEEQIRCTAEGWSPNPRCYSKSVRAVSTRSREKNVYLY